MRPFLPVFWMILVVFCCFSCQEEDMAAAIFDEKESLTGHWVHVKYDDSVEVMRKAPSLDENAAGLTFYTNGTLVERANSGWCGTPPIVYKNYEGSWKQAEGTMLNITSAFWGGIQHYDLKIVALTGDTLKVVRKHYSQEE